MMSNAFAELNPVVIPRTFPVYKKVAIIMNKLLLNQYPRSITENSKEFSMSFTDTINKSQLKNYSGSEISISFSKESEPFCNLTINMKDKLLKIEYNSEIYSDINDPKGLTKHIIDNKKFKVKARSFLRMMEETNEEGEIANKFPTGDHFFTYIKFFEKNISKRLVKLCLIQDFNNPIIDVSLSIPDFCKMGVKGLLDDNSLASKEAVNTLIDDLMYMDSTNVERIQAGILRITRTKGEWGSYRIYFGGTVVCNEYSLKRFKYLFHPGLNLVAKYLESEDKSESLKHKIEKEVFRKL
jgi:hypothetical protein